MFRRTKERSNFPMDVAQITVLQRRLRVQRVVYGVLCTLVCVVIAVVLVAFTDYILRPRAETSRLALSMLLLVAVILAMRRWLIPALRDRTDKLAVARRLERRHPELGDRISSAIGLPDPSTDDADAGSAALRSAAVRACERELRNVEVSRVVDYRPVLRMLGMTFLLLAVSAMFACPRVPLVRSAIARIVFPLRDYGWPQQVHLKVADAPRRLAAGTDWNLRIVEQSGLSPEDAVVRFRDATGSMRRETVVPLSVTPEGMTARRRHVTRSFEFHVQAGDDRDMPWQRVDVVPPPRVVAFDVTTFPPVYTRREPQSAPSDLLVLSGTGIEIVGQSSRPVERITLVLDSGERIPAHVTRGGQQFKIDADSFRVAHSDTYAFELVDAYGLVASDPQRHRIVVEDDPPPRIRLVEPEEGVVIRPHAVLPLHVVAEDNLFVERLSLFFRRAGDPPNDERPVPAVVEELETSREGGTHSQSIDELSAYKTLRINWDVTPLDLSPGDDLILAAASADARPGSKTSRVERRISVVSESQWNRWLAQREDRVRQAVSNALRLHHDAMKAIASVQPQAEDAPRRGPSGRDHLASALRLERDVQRLLTGSDDSAVAHVNGLIRMFRINEPDNQALAGNWQPLLRSLSEIGQHRVVRIQFAIDRTGDAMEAENDVAASPGKPSSLEERLNEIRGSQQEVAEELRDSLEQLERQNAWQNTARAARDMREQHGQIIHDLSDITAKLLAGEASPLENAEVETLKRLGERYLEMARQLAASVRTENGASVGSSSGSMAAPTAEVLSAARQLRSAARLLEHQQVGRVLGQQARITGQLDDLIKAAESVAVTPSGDAVHAEEARGDPAAVQGREDLLDRVRSRLPSDARQWIAPWPDAPFVPRYRKQTEDYFRRLAEEP